MTNHVLRLSSSLNKYPRWLGAGSCSPGVFPAKTNSTPALLILEWGR